jgi:phasin family protein
MVQITEQVAALGKSQLEAALKLAEVAGSNLEKLTEVQLKSAKAAYEDSVKALRQLAAIKDPSELAALSSGAAQPAWDKAAGYVKEVYGAVSAAQTEFAAVLERQVAEFNRSVAATLDAVAQSAPPGAEGAVAGIKSAVNAANGLYDAMLKSARQLASIGEAGVTAATEHPVAGKKKTAA